MRLWHAYIKGVRLLENHILYRRNRALDRNCGEDKCGEPSFTNDFEASTYLMTSTSDRELCEAAMRAMKSGDRLANNLDVLHE